MAGEFFQEALLVEDEKNLQTALEIALKKLGIRCRVAANLSQARKLYEASPPPFILLDRTLPDGDGLSFCRELREEGYFGAILMLTARGQIDERVEGLNAGADDYLPKPFSWQELEARIRNLARRTPIAAPSTKPVSDWDLDEQRLRIHGPRGWVELTPLEFKLAARLIVAGGAIVSRDDLLKDVWGFTLLPKTRTVDHFLGRMRKHFEADPENPRHFLTVRGAGYRFER